MNRIASCVRVLKALLLIVLLALPLIRPVEANYYQDEAAEFFYLKLAPYGNWVQHPVYGRVWFPRGVPEDWRPYQDGYWAYTDDYGWLWVSDWDEEWGWATYHYGRWVWDDGYGWLWVPGSVWAPAWVVWRYGGGYVSWAPMPIQFYWDPFVSATFSFFDFDRYLGWDCWVTTREHDFPRRNMPRRWVKPHMNHDVLHGTRFAPPLRVVGGHVVNSGITRQWVEHATGSTLHPVIPAIVQQDEPIRRGGRPQGREQVRIYRPLTSGAMDQAVRNEAGFHRALAESISMHRRLTPENHAVAEDDRTVRRPGRLSGRPMPFGDQPEAQNPPANAVENLPRAPDERGFSHAPEPMQPSAPDSSQIQPDLRQYGDRFNQERPNRLPPLNHRRERQTEQDGVQPQQEQAIRQQQEAEHQGLELERQQQAEQARMQHEALRQQQETHRQQHIEDVLQQRHLESNQQAEQERQQQEAQRQQQEEAERQRQDMDRQQQAEQERQQQEAQRQQHEEAIQQRRTEHQRRRQEAQ